MTDPSAHAPAGDTPPQTLRVLSLDGGAIRGYYSARLIERLTADERGQASDVDVGAAFDLIVGTSAGAILGASLAAGISASRVCAFYRASGPAIFRHPSPLGWTSVLWSMRHWRSPPADADALRSALVDALGAETLGQLYARRRIALCVTSTDVTTSHPHVFATPHRAGHDDERDLSLVDACLASASAPMLLPPASIGHSRSQLWCDGGIWATSPLWIALVEALALADRRTIEIVSIGTCPVPLGVGPTREAAKGLAFWTRGVRALQVGADAQANAAIEWVPPLLAHLGDRVRLVRLRDPEPEPHEASELRLDNASDAAFAAMDALAERAVELNADVRDSLLRRVG